MNDYYILLKIETESKYLEPNCNNEDDEVYVDVLRPVAIFSSKELAEEYAKESTLKNPGINGKYKVASVLRYATGYEIVKLSDYLPIDPQ